MTEDNSTQFNNSLSLSCSVNCSLVANSDITCISISKISIYIYIPGVKTCTGEYSHSPVYTHLLLYFL